MKTSQNPEIDKQILMSLERISEAFRVLLWEQGKIMGLSPIQIQLLIFISSHPADKCKVTYLAEEFNLTKATVSESVKVLIKKGYLYKTIDITDTRSFSLALTALGLDVTRKISGFNSVVTNLIGEADTEEKNIFYNVLHKLIKGLNDKGIISIQRNCSTCKFYRFMDGEHFCRLLNSGLKSHELRIDCSEHELI